MVRIEEAKDPVKAARVGVMVKGMSDPAIVRVMTAKLVPVPIYGCVSTNAAADEAAVGAAGAIDSAVVNGISISKVPSVSVPVGRSVKVEVAVPKCPIVSTEVANGPVNVVSNGLMVIVVRDPLIVGVIMEIRVPVPMYGCVKPKEEIL